MGNILLNLTILGVFKYYDFFVASFAELFGIADCDSLLLRIILPVGISFYTFQALSYSIDVYREKLAPTRDIVAFFAFISFFPQLVAGPIERATNLLPQFLRPRTFDTAQAVNGLRQALWGFFKKIVVADNCAILANGIFDNYENLSGGALVIGAVAFSFQIYGDFSGYSDIAIGISRLFGFSLMRNFNYPYFSRDIAEFWRRWHISLTRWFTDYVYIPLGGSRKSTLRMYLNQMIAMVACGLWHGASLSFIVWGALHGALVCLHKFFSQTVLHHDRHYHPRGWRRFVAVFVTFHVVCLTWLLFRNATFEGTWVMLEQMFTKFNPDVLPEVLLTYKYVFALMVFALVSHWIPDSWQDQLIKVFAKGGVTLAAVAIAVVIFVIMQVKGSEVQPFIYFQF